MIYIVFDPIWIIRRLINEWKNANPKAFTKDTKRATLVWVFSHYREIPEELSKLPVLTTIHHIDETKVALFFEEVEKRTTWFHAICTETARTLKKYTQKPIFLQEMWENPDIWNFGAIHRRMFQSESIMGFNKCEESTSSALDTLKKKYKIPTDRFVIGSFQCDTEGTSVPRGQDNSHPISGVKYQPKLSKGPDIFVNIVSDINKRKNESQKICVLLTGYRRQYVIQQLQNLGIETIYHPMVSQQKLSEIYRCVDLYIVASRTEGGPRAIYECALTKTPIISTRVGMAESILPAHSLFDSNEWKSYIGAKTDTETAYRNVQSYLLPSYMTKFNELFAKTGHPISKM